MWRSLFTRHEERVKYQPLPKRHGKSLIVKRALSMLSHYRSHLHVCTVQHSLSLTFVSVAVQFQPTISYICIIILKPRSLTQMLPSSSCLHFQCRALSSPFLFSSSSSPPSPTAAIMLLMMSRHRRRALTWGRMHWFWWRSTVWYWCFSGRSSAACRLASWSGTRLF